MDPSISMLKQTLLLFPGEEKMNLQSKASDMMNTQAIRLGLIKKEIC
jgi:hypothetical protein